MVLYVQHHRNHVNAKRLPPLSGTLGCRGTKKKGRPHPFSPSRNTSSPHVGANAQGYLGSLRSGGARRELSHFPHGRVASSEKANRNQHMGKQDETAPSRGHGEPITELAETRDPLANLKRLEEGRPGFQWRGTQKLQRLVHGAENSNDKSER